MNDQIKVATDMKPVFEEAELLNDVRTAMKQIDEGLVVSNDDAKAALRKRFSDL